ncbi:MAG: hypothetical protein ACRDAQ_00005, partial [Cetobacterium sp.]
LFQMKMESLNHRILFHGRTGDGWRVKKKRGGGTTTSSGDGRTGDVELGKGGERGGKKNI